MSRRPDLRRYAAARHASRAVNLLRKAFPAVRFDVVDSPFASYAFAKLIRATMPDGRVAYVGKGPIGTAIR